MQASDYCRTKTGRKQQTANSSGFDGTVDIYRINSFPPLRYLYHLICISKTTMESLRLYIGNLPYVAQRKDLENFFDDNNIPMSVHPAKPH
jgi:hypothetical protein